MGQQMGQEQKEEGNEGRQRRAAGSDGNCNRLRRGRNPPASEGRSWKGQKKKAAGRSAKPEGRGGSGREFKQQAQQQPG